MFIDLREGERKHQPIASQSTTCPKLGSNPQPFGVGDHTATSCATRPGLHLQYHSLCYQSDTRHRGTSPLPTQVLNMGAWKLN